MVKYLTKYGANLNIRAEDGMNAVHVACQNGSLEMVQYLVNILLQYLYYFMKSDPIPLH